MLCHFLVIFAALSAPSLAKFGNRIANPAPLLECKWSQDGKDFQCEKKSDTVQFNIFSPTSNGQFGSSEIAGTKSSIDVHVTSKADHTCLLLDYCISGADSRLSVKAGYTYAVESQLLWSRQGNAGKECRELIQTVYDKTSQQKHDFSFVTVMAELLGLPSSFRFERIAMFDGACKIRLEGDYYREMDQHLTGNYDSFAKDEIHGDDYFNLETDNNAQFMPMWPAGAVPYIDSFSQDRTQMLQAAFNAIEDVSCVRFKNLTTPPTAGTYLEISDKRKDCFTEVVGVINQQRRVILNMGENCWKEPRTLLHELMHVLGFSHETNRPDRDFYVGFNFKNVEQGKLYEFEAHDTLSSPVTTFNLPYDFSSIMHFRTDEFKSASTTEKTVIATKDQTIQLGGNVLSEIDKIKIQSAFCSKTYTCVAENCPFDSICFNHTVGCKCMTELSGSPGSCLGVMDPHNDKDCGASLSSYGKTVEVGNSNLPLCLCKTADSSIEIGKGLCQFISPRKRREASKNEAAPTPRATCAFGYRQLPSSKCDSVPEAVQLRFTAISLLIPENLASESITTLSGLKLSELASWTDDLLNTNSQVFLKASKTVRFEILRALSLIYYGDDSLLTKTSGFDTLSSKQEPWVNPTDSIKFSKDPSSGTFGISVVVYFTQPVYYDISWLKSRLLTILGLDSAARDNGFILIRGKQSFAVDSDVCRIFARPSCQSDSYCQRGYSIGKMSTCAPKKSIPEPSTPRPTFAPITFPSPTTVAPTVPTPVTVAPAKSESSGLTTLEIVLIAVAGALALIIIIIVLWLCCRKGGKDKDNKSIEEVEMSPVSPVAKPLSPPTSAVTSPSPPPSSPAAFHPPQPAKLHHYTNEGYNSPTGVGSTQEGYKPVAF